LMGTVFTDTQGNSRIQLLNKDQLAFARSKGMLPESNKSYSPVICEDVLSINNIRLTIFNIFIRFVNTCIYKKWEKVELSVTDTGEMKIVWLNLDSAARNTDYDKSFSVNSSTLSVANINAYLNPVKNEMLKIEAKSKP